MLWAIDDSTNSQKQIINLVRPNLLHFIIDKVNTKSAADWIILNPGVPYYHRTNYDGYMWDALTNVLNNNHESIVKQQNRAQLIDDAFALGRYEIKQIYLHSAS